MTDEERIVKDLRWFVSYYPKWGKENDPRPTLEEAADTIEAMQNVLEAKDRMLAAMDFAVSNLEKKIAKIKRERDAAVADINMCCPCEVCTRSCTYYKVNPYDECAEFEWRGVSADA